MAVWRAFCHISRTDTAAATWLVLNNNRLPDAISQFCCDNARNRVDRCPAWIAYDNSDSVRRVNVLRDRADDWRSCQQRKGQIDTFELHGWISFAGNQGMYFSS